MFIRLRRFRLRRTYTRRGAAKGRPPARRLLGLSLVLALVLAGSGLLLARLPDTGRAGNPEPGGDFHLLADTGQTVSPESFDGRYLLIYFGYTHCQDVCPTTLSAIDQALAALKPAVAARVQPLFITVDPARDTPGVLHRYLSAFGGHVLGLTGNRQAIAAAEHSFHISATDYADPDGGYDIDHTSVLILAAPNGRIIAPIRADGSPTAIAAALSRYLS